jgi:osmotically-inducible protein OsmY
VTQATHTSDHDIQATVLEKMPTVGVAVREGVVTLSGEAGSLPERIAATRAAMRVSGVRAIADELHVRVPGTSAGNDTDIAQTAGQLLSWAVDVPSDTVTAEVRDHVITLAGQVTWNYQREAAGRAVRHIHGVTGVANTITVRQGTAASVITDAVE